MCGAIEAGHNLLRVIQGSETPPAGAMFAFCKPHPASSIFRRGVVVAVREHAQLVASFLQADPAFGKETQNTHGDNEIGMIE